MRKLILIAAFALTTVAAQAGESRNLVPAANDAPLAATAVTTPAEAKPALAAAETAKPETSRKQASRSKKTARATDEQKARRIAAKYGVSW
jgi:hypothetical protein